MSILIFLLTLSVLVFVHEFGHFLAAKKSGVKVEEFGFGLPPRLWGWRFGETLYSLNLLPIGGFVKLKGEEGPSRRDRDEADEVLGFGEKDSFATAGILKRIVIVGSGVLGNLLLAYLIFYFLFLVGYPRFFGQVKVEEVAAGSPAQVAQILPGDVVVEVAGQKVETPDDFLEQVTRLKGQEVALVILRQEQTLSLAATPRADPPAGQGPLGVRIVYDSQLTYEKSGLGKASVDALEEVGHNLKLMLQGLRRMVINLFVGKVPQDIAGVVGIYRLSSQAYQIGSGIFLQFVAIISLNLFVFNLLPLPALDGGRLLFILLEVVLRRRLNPKVEKIVNNLGLALLLILFVLITIRDFQRF